jgi:hypothetical protein
MQNPPPSEAHPPRPRASPLRDLFLRIAVHPLIFPTFCGHGVKGIMPRSRSRPGSCHSYSSYGIVATCFAPPTRKGIVKTFPARTKGAEGATGFLNLQRRRDESIPSRPFDPKMSSCCSEMP